MIASAGITSRTFLMTGLQSGTTYQFRVQARNIIGYGTPSTAVSILCATITSRPSAPTTHVNVNNVIVTWTAPLSDNGAAVTAYQVLIRQADLVTYSQDTVNCNGANDLIRAALTCSIPMTTLTAAPFSLPTGASVFAQIIAINAMGASQTSDAGNGAVLSISTVPSAPVGL